jgi:hypothetical protein
VDLIAKSTGKAKKWNNRILKSLIMNQTEKAFIKKRASSFRKRRASLQQCLSSITSRKRLTKLN